MLNRISILIAVGVTLGVIGAAVLSKFLVSLLFGVSPFDPLAFVFASGFLVVVALLAAFIPARRAARINPIIALRHE
jgi:putative ABC transport system permease protein